MSDTQRPPASEAELRTVAMPADTNPHGDIFGGWLLSQMDVAGGTHAMARTGGRVATVGIEAMSFHRPVYVGDRVSCHCRTERIGRTSISVHVETWVRRTRSGQGPRDIKVTEGMFTYVAMAEGGGKRVIESRLDLPSAHDPDSRIQPEVRRSSASRHPSGLD